MSRKLKSTIHPFLWILSLPKPIRSIWWEPRRSVGSMSNFHTSPQRPTKFGSVNSMPTRSRAEIPTAKCSPTRSSSSAHEPIAQVAHDGCVKKPVSAIDHRAIRTGSNRHQCRFDHRTMARDFLGGLAALNEAIELHDVTVTYERHPAVHHLSGAFKAGSLTAVAGPNGAGKSTLLKCIMGELSLAGGSINRHTLSRRDIGYLPQAAEIDRTFPITVADTIITGVWRQAGAF